jgi:hypothetical protein
MISKNYFQKKCLKNITKTHFLSQQINKKTFLGAQQPTALLHLFLKMVILNLLAQIAKITIAWIAE